MQSSPLHSTLCHFLHLRSKCSHQHPVAYKKDQNSVAYKLLLEDLGIDGRIILERILEKKGQNV
jgi:hypothetical protein